MSNARRQVHLQKRTDLDKRIARYPHKKLPCISCGDKFTSTGPHNRMCPHCASSPTNQTIGGNFV